MGPRVLVVDNYDSFVYNLVQYLGELGADPVVRRNDAISVEEAEALEPDALVISPGPGHPGDAGVSVDMVRRLGPRVPLLGVCLGHQCIAEAYGGRVVRADVVMHGKTSVIHHDGSGVLADLPDPFEATRYHSLVVDPAHLPPALEVTARTDDGTIMGIRHTSMAVEGVQFHPESVLTEVGHQLVENFVTALAAC